MKIAFVFPPMWTPHSDGSLQIWNREVTSQLSKTHRVSVYAGTYDSFGVECVGTVLYKRVPALWDSRLLKRLQYIRRDARRPIFASDFWYPMYALRVALDIRRSGVDVVHVYNYPQFATLIKWLNPAARVVLNVHGDVLTKAGFRNVESRLQRIDLIVSCSDFVTRSIREALPNVATRCKTVPMGVCPQTFSSRRSSYETSGRRPLRLLYVGRISPEKGVHVLLEAFERIVSTHPDATLTIVGPEWVAPREDITDLFLDRAVVSSLERYYDGGYLQQMKQSLSPAAAQRVTFAGLVKHSDVAAHYAKADIYISPSLYESFGMSIIEAMVAGVPVVAARGGAVPDLIANNRTGLLVDVANPSAIADAVIGLAANPQLRRALSTDARSIVCERFSWDTISSDLLQLYREVLAPASQSAPQPSAYVV